MKENWSRMSGFIEIIFLWEKTTPLGVIIYHVI